MKRKTTFVGHSENSPQKCIALNAYIRKKKISNVNFYFRKLKLQEKEEQIKSKVNRRNK